MFEPWSPWRPVNGANYDYDYDYDYGFTLGWIGESADSAQPYAGCWIWLHFGGTWDSPRKGPYKEDTPDLGDWKTVRSSWA